MRDWVLVLCLASLGWMATMWELPPEPPARQSTLTMMLERNIRNDCFPSVPTPWGPQGGYASLPWRTRAAVDAAITGALTPDDWGAIAVLLGLDYERITCIKDRVSPTT